MFALCGVSGYDHDGKAWPQNACLLLHASVGFSY